MQIGEALNFGNPNEIITVRLKNGSQISAIAANVINSTKVLVAGNRVWSETSPQNVLDLVSIRKIVEDKTEQEEELTQVFLPFQVLFIDPELGVGLGGDRPQINLDDFQGSIIIGGINNLGSKQFLSVWEREDCNIIVNKNLSPSFNQLPEDFCPLPEALWLGAGYLTTPLLRAETPETTPIIEETGEALPSFVDIPPYPIYINPTAVREGTRIESRQTDDGKYKFFQEESWDYVHATRGNSGGTPDPSYVAGGFTGNCYGGAGIAFVYDFYRDTSFDYSKKLNWSAELDVQIWWNNRAYTGTRKETYSETQTLAQTPALMNAFYSIYCQILFAGSFGTGFGVWRTGTVRSFFTGEEIVTKRDYTRTVDEQLVHPVTLAQTVINLEKSQENYTETATLTMPKANWVVPSGVYGYDYEVEGEEIKTSQKLTDINMRNYQPLLLSGNGNQSLYLAEAKTSKVTVEEYKQSPVKKIMRNYTTYPVIQKNWIITTIAQIEETRELRFTDNTTTFALPLDNSFYFSSSRSLSAPSLGQFTLQNDDDTPIFSGSIQYIKSYIEVEDKSHPHDHFKTYSDVVTEAIPFWENIVGNLVYVSTGERRFTGTITGIDYEDNPNPELEIDIIRSINSLTISLVREEEYTGGNPNSLEVYPQDNLSQRIYGILNSSDRNYCNLVNSTIYYSKSVASRLEQNQQSTEVYQIVGDRIIQLPNQGGGFIPVEDSSRVLGISYFPS